MNWTDCPIIEQIPGKMSGAPVVRGTRMRPQDIVGNAEMGAAWIADAHGMRVEDVPRWGLRISTGRIVRWLSGRRTGLVAIRPFAGRPCGRLTFS